MVLADGPGCNPLPVAAIWRQGDCDLMHIWHLRNCGTCKEAVKALRDRKPVLTDVRDDRVAEADMRRFLEKIGEDKLVNKSSIPWQTMSEQERAGDKLALLLAHPTLMKRPVIEEGDQITAGWTPAVRKLWGV
jgi:arsenate reductase (glutaredoxin)